MRPSARSALLLLCAALLCVLPLSSAFTPVSRRQSNIDAAAARGEPLVLPDRDCLNDDGSTVWMCISTVLVLGMCPALALFEAGMLRSKSTVSIVTQVISGVVTLSVMWILIGFTLTFGPSQGGFIGNLDHALFIDVSYTDCSTHAPQIPEALFAMFQMMFAAITPLLMTGAFAERLKFKSFMWFIVLWEFLVYYPLAHWIWGGGWLGKWGTLDFAGGIVIHTSAGIGSLISALYLGRRKHFFDFMGEYPPSNLPLAATGAALLWIGWFGFNGGSALASGPLAVSAITSTQVGCSCGAFAWLMLSWMKEKPQSVALMNGALAGLAGITPASGYINTPASIALGFIFGIASFYSVVMMKHHLHIDDALDVSSVHGLTGMLGALGLGFFAQLRIDPIGGANGAFYGHPMQIVYQLVGILVALAWAGFWSFVLLKGLDMVTTGGIRIGEDEEEVGMDWAEHHEIAYHKLHVLDDAEKAQQAEAPTYTHVDDHSANGAYRHMMDDVSLGHVSAARASSGASSSPPAAAAKSASTAMDRMAMPSTVNYKRASPNH